jgi:hypothetical protein
MWSRRGGLLRYRCAAVIVVVFHAGHIRHRLPVRRQVSDE